jgi:hypothetical protein
MVSRSCGIPSVLAAAALLLRWSLLNGCTYLLMSECECFRGGGAQLAGRLGPGKTGKGAW